ncbi:hypothetical protein HDU85_003638 [Gaertneriomyces sp. JEL0708]|nr:hypothetical protein HDU85_003638 [Gaertneriomyces sp. JEL0708]
MAEYIVVPSCLVHEIPSHLSYTEAAALPLAGLTAYRATFSQGQVNSHSTVLISGIGGGVALFCLQFCVAVGAKVCVTSSDPDKIQKAVSLGAHGGANYREADWEKKIRQVCPAFDVVIDGAGGDAIAAYLRLLRPGGTLVTYGATARPAATILMPNIFLKQITVKGSTMGNEVEFASMLKLVADTQLRPVISAVWKGLSSAENAMEVMRKGGQMGKLLIELCVENSPRL